MQTTRPRDGGVKGGRGARGPAGSPDSARSLTGGKAQTADFLRPRYRCLNVPRRRPAEAFSAGSLAAELVRGAEAPGEARGEDGERGSRGLRPRLSHRSARRQTLSRGLCSYLHRGGVWKHVELTVAPQAQGTKPSEKPGVRLHGRVRRARLTERPRPRRPPLPASPQAWRWTPPIDGGGADRRDGGVGGGRRAQLLCPRRAGSHAPASRCSVQEPRGRRRPGEHAQTANVRGLQPPAPRLLP